MRSSRRLARWTTPALALALAALVCALTGALSACNPLDPYGCATRPPLLAEDHALADATFGESYEQPLGVRFYPAGINLIDGVLPRGLDIASVHGAPVVRGIPLEAGAFDVSLQAYEYSAKCTARAVEFAVHLDVNEP